MNSLANKLSSTKIDTYKIIIRTIHNNIVHLKAVIIFRVPTF